MPAILMRFVQLSFIGLIWSAISDSAMGEQNAVRPSRIFVHSIMRTANGDVDQIIAIEPEFGEWSKIADGGRNLRVSPNGQNVVFERAAKIGFCATDGSAVVQWLLDLKGRPVWSPDGESMMCSEVRRLNGELRHQSWLISLAEPNKPRKTAVPATDTVMDWSADGKWIATASHRDAPKEKGWQLYAMRPDGSEAQRLTGSGNNFHARFSPDGTRIAYTDHSQSKERIKIADVAGESSETIFQAPFAMKIDGLSWAPDGKRLVISVCDWHEREDGSRVFPGPRPFDPNYRFLFMDADGRHTKELALKNTLRVRHLGVPHWR